MLMVLAGCFVGVVVVLWVEVLLFDWWMNRRMGRRPWYDPEGVVLRGGEVVADSHPEVSAKEDRLRAGWKEGKR